MQDTKLEVTDRSRLTGHKEVRGGGTLARRGTEVMK